MIGVYSIFRHTCSLFWSQISWFYIRVCILISAGHGQKNALSLAQRSRLLTPGSWLTSPEIDKLCPCVYAYIRYHCVVNSPVFWHSSWPRNWLTRPPRASLPEVRKEDHQAAPKPWAITRHGGLWWLGKCMNMDERMAFPLEITCMYIYIYCYIAADMNAFRLEWWNNGGVQGCILSASGTSWPTIADPWSIGDVFDDLWSKICTVSTQVNGARFILGAGHHQFMNENSGNILGDRLWLRDTGPDRTKHSQGAQQFSSSWVCPQLGYPKIPSSIVLFPVEIANLGFWGYPRIPNPWTHPLEAVLKLPPTKPAHRPSASRWRLNNGRLTHLSIVGDIWSKPLGIKLHLCPQNPQTNRSLCGLHFAGLVC